jgi:hypothetical protein
MDHGPILEGLRLQARRFEQLQFQGQVPDAKERHAARRYVEQSEIFFFSYGILVSMNIIPFGRHPSAGCRIFICSTVFLFGS